MESLSRSLEEIAENLPAEKVILANSKFNARKSFDQQFQMVLMKTLKDCVNKVDSVQLKPRRYIKPQKSFSIEVADALRQYALEVSHSLTEEEIAAANRFFKFESSFGPDLQLALRISLVGELPPHSPPLPVVNPPHEARISYTPINSNSNHGAFTPPSSENVNDTPDPLVQKFIDERLKRRLSLSEESLKRDSPNSDVSRTERNDRLANKIEDNKPISSIVSVNESSLQKDKNSSKHVEGKSNIDQVIKSNDQRNSTDVASKLSTAQRSGGLASVKSAVGKYIAKIQETSKRENSIIGSQAENRQGKAVAEVARPDVHSQAAQDDTLRLSSPSQAPASVSTVNALENQVHNEGSDSEEDFGTIVSWDERGGLDVKLDKMMLKSVKQTGTPLNEVTREQRKSVIREFFDAPSFYDTLNSKSTNGRYESTTTSPQDVISNSTTYETPESLSSISMQCENHTTLPTTTRNSEATSNTEIPSFQDVFQPINSESSARCELPNDDRSPSTSLEDRHLSATMTESSMAGTAKLFQHSMSSSTYRSSNGGNISKDDALKSALQILKKSLENPVIQEDSIRSVVVMLEEVLLQSSLSSSLYSFISQDKGPDQSSQVNNNVSNTDCVDYERVPSKFSPSRQSKQASSGTERRFSGNHRRNGPTLFVSEFVNEIKNSVLQSMDENPPAPASLQSKSVLHFGDKVSNSNMADSAVQRVSNQRVSQLFAYDSVDLDSVLDSRRKLDEAAIQRDGVNFLTQDRRLSNASAPAHLEDRKIFPSLENLKPDHKNDLFPVTPKFSSFTLNQSTLHGRSVYIPGSSESVEQLLSYKSNRGRSLEPKAHGGANSNIQDSSNSFIYSASIQNSEQRLRSNQNYCPDKASDSNAPRHFNQSQRRWEGDMQPSNMEHVWLDHPNNSDVNVTIDSLTSSPFQNLNIKPAQSPKTQSTKPTINSCANLSRSSSSNINVESFTMMNDSQVPREQSPRATAFENSPSPLHSSEFVQFPHDEQYSFHYPPVRVNTCSNEEWYQQLGSSDRPLGVSHDRHSSSKVHIGLPDTINPLAARNKVSSPNYSSYFDAHVQPLSSPHRNLHLQQQQSSLPPLPHFKFPISSTRQPLRSSIHQPGYYQTLPQYHDNELMYHDITIEQLSTTSSITEESTTDYQCDSADEPSVPIELPYQLNHHSSHYQQRESYYNTAFRNYEKRIDGKDRFFRTSARESDYDYGSKQISRTISRQQVTPPLNGMTAVKSTKGSWACSVCTLINNPDFLVCEVCGSVR